MPVKQNALSSQAANSALLLPPDAMWTVFLKIDSFCLSIEIVPSRVCKDLLIVFVTLQQSYSYISWTSINIFLGLQSPSLKKIIHSGLDPFI